MTIYHVYANRSNVGDWLSARGIQRALGNQTVEELLCDDPFVPDTLARLDELDGSSLVVIGGGGLFMDYFAPFWRGLLALEKGLRYVIWGVGYVDLKSEPSRIPDALVREVVDRSVLCIVRDQHTRDIIGSDRIPEPVLCPALLVLGHCAEPGHGVLHVVNLTTVGQEAYEAMVSAGRSFAERTGRDYREVNNRIKSDSERLLMEAVSAYRNCDVVLTSRLHGAILGLAVGRPVVAVSGDWKLEGFMRAVGLDEWVLDHRDLDRLESLLETATSQPSVEPVLADHRAENLKIGAEVLDAFRWG